jgi:nitrite reductase/ring-hydroxylating ferredoxin subunit
MNRYEFLKSLGFSGAALMAALTSCTKAEDAILDAPRIDVGTTTTPTTPTVPVTPVTGTSELDKITNPLVKIDISSTSTSSLKKVGGYVISNNIVVAQVSAGTFAAVTNLCSHEPKRKVIFSQGEFYCTDHGARFDLTGKGLNANGSKGITAYKVATDGKLVVVYS